MKFYEVQKALEEGKKIKSTKYGTFFLKDGYLYFENGSLIEFLHGLAIYVILADDWEIIEDIKEVKTGMSKSIDMSIDFSKFPDHAVYLWYQPPEQSIKR